MIAVFFLLFLYLNSYVLFLSIYCFCILFSQFNSIVFDVLACLQCAHTVLLLNCRCLELCSALPVQFNLIRLPSCCTIYSPSIDIHMHVCTSAITWYRLVNCRVRCVVLYTLIDIGFSISVVRLP